MTKDTRRAYTDDHSYDAAHDQRLTIVTIGGQSPSHIVNLDANASSNAQVANGLIGIQEPLTQSVQGRPAVKLRCSRYST
jgi:hypothetical protein